MSEEEGLEEFKKEVDRVYSLIEGLIQLNNIPTSTAVSALCSVMVSILIQYKDPAHFYRIINLMKTAFEGAHNE